MLYLICYDIEPDRLRKKVSDRLLADGLERVQYSVFMGPLKAGLKAKLVQWLEALMEDQATGHNDSVLIMQLQPEAVRNLKVIGMDRLDREYLAGDTHTLIL